MNEPEEKLEEEEIEVHIGDGVPPPIYIQPWRTI